MCFTVLFFFIQTLHELDKLGETDTLLCTFCLKWLNHRKLTSSYMSPPISTLISLDSILWLSWGVFWHFV